MIFLIACIQSDITQILPVVFPYFNSASNCSFVLRFFVVAFLWKRNNILLPKFSVCRLILMLPCVHTCTVSQKSPTISKITLGKNTLYSSKSLDTMHVVFVLQRRRLKIYNFSNVCCSLVAEVLVRHTLNQHYMGRFFVLGVT